MLLLFKYQESFIYLSQMKMILQLLLLTLITVQVLAESHQTLQLDKPYPQNLNQSTMFTGRYVFAIAEQNAKKMIGDKWFFFVEVQPNQENEWINTNIEISIGKKGSEQSRNERTCATNRGGIDSCFFTNKQFDYKTQDIHVRVHCRGECKFKLSAEISQPYKLTPGEEIDMDFQNTAYSKVFTLDTSNKKDFDQLRIILKPQGFLQFPAPIGLYVNKGTQLPTRKSHDFQSITLWDNGEGIFIDSPDSQNIFTILVQSPEKNLLILSTELISFKNSYDIPQNLPYFDYVSQGTKKLYKAKVHPLKGVCVKLSTFSGSLQLSKIYDKQMQQIKNQFPELYRSFSEIQYQIPAQFFKKNEAKYQISEQIIFQIEGIKESTFLIQAYQLNKGITHLIPVVNRYVDLGGQASNQYYIDLVEMNTPQFKKSQIQIVLTHEENKKIKTRFFQCNKTHGRDCQIKKSQLKQANVQSDDFKELIPTLTETVGAVTIYKFYLKTKQFKTVKNDTKQYIITLYVENQQKDEQLYTIRYTNIGHNVYLKQKQVQKERISIDQSKYYLYTNRHTDVKEIRVHLMQIAGRVHIEGYYDDPRVLNLEGKEIYDFHNAVKFTNLQQNQTIYIKVTGKQVAYYSLQVQSIKENDKDWWKRIQNNRSKGYNEIVIFQDIPYEFSLEPNQKAVYQIHTKHKQFNLDMSSLLPLQLCMTEQISKAPFPPNCEVKQQLSKREMMTVQMERGKIANIGVTNNHSKSNKFNIKISSLDNNSTDSHPVLPDDNYTTSKCLPALLGKTIKYTIEKESSTCYTYLVSKIESIEFTLDVVSDQYNEIKVLVALGQERIEVLGANHIFKKNQVEKACKGQDPCLLKVFIDSKVKTQLRFSVQTLQGTVFLLDGIASSFSGTNTKRYFAYQVYNKLNTTIILQNKHGYYKFYGTIVEASTYWKQKQTFQFPTALSNTIKSNNPFYYAYQLAILTQNQIIEAKCKECLLLLTVEKQKDSSSDQKSRFTIECTQQEKFLKQSSSVTNYLSKRSFAFYQLYNSKAGGTILVSLNTQNQQCAKIYAKKGQIRATGSQYDYHSTTNILIIQKAENASYTVTVQATQDCYYSIDYTTSKNKIYTSLSAGIYTDVRLDKQQSQKVAYHHKTNDSFRILTLHQTGEVVINVRAYKTMKEYFDEATTKTKNVWSGKDFLRIEKTDITFCFDCYYIIELSAERQTKTSIIIPSEAAEFPIMVDSIMKEELRKGQYERLRVYTDKIVQYQINVQYGAVNVSFYTKDNDKNYFFTKIYRANQATQYQLINGTKDAKTDSFYYAQFTKIILKAEQDSGFYFSLISDKDVTKRGNRIKYGIPEYVTLEKNKQQCLIGTLDNLDEQFLISITGENDTLLMNNLEITCKTSDKKLLQLSKEIAKSQMIVKIEKPPKTLPTQYEFCMKAKENVFLTFIQSSRLLYLPESTTVMVSGSMNFSFYSEGKSILQINECKSRAVTTIYHSFAASSNNANSEIKQVRRSNNIVEFMYYGPVYVQVNTQTATIAWRKKDETKNLGKGYEEYSPGKIRYDIADKKLKITISGLKINANIAKPSVEFGQTSFTAYLAEEEINLYQAINCASGTHLQQTFRKSTAKDEVTIYFDLDKVLEKFGTKKYILIGALVNATSKIKDDGKYRFLYPYQQIPISVLKGGKPEDIIIIPRPNPTPRPKPIDSQPEYIEKGSNSWQILMNIAFSIAAIALAFVIYRKFLKRFFKRRRMEKLSEQGTGEVRYQQFASESSNR